MENDVFDTIVQPLYEIIKKQDGIETIQITHTEENQLVLRVTSTVTRSILRVANNLTYGSSPWEVTLLGTDTPSHILVRGVLDLEGWKWEDVKREVDYKVCLLKL